MIIQAWLVKTFNDTVVNPALLFLNGGSFEILLKACFLRNPVHLRKKEDDNDSTDYYCIYLEHRLKTIQVEHSMSSF